MRKLLVLAIVLVPACKKQQAAVPEPVAAPHSVETALQVVTVSPSVVPSGRASTVTVVGAGFQAGATARIGTQSATASVRNPNQLDVTVPSMAPGTYDVTITNPDTTDATLTAGLSVRAPEAATGLADVESCQHVVLYFDTDAASPPQDAVQTLQSIVPCLQATGVPIQVDGHADERGTTDYNVALAQHRALAVADLLVTAGVAKSRLVVTSYGEERPLDSGFGEAAWAKNRRVEITLAF